MSLVDDLVELEWLAFDKVKNVGGRASCQDDFATFRIMRKSQFQAWDVATLTSYFADLTDAARRGRNVVQEKYARMMESTDPLEYAAFAHLLPRLEPTLRKTIEFIVARQLDWREEFERNYPCLSAQGRLVRAEADGPAGTSFETYLRGELATYSKETLHAYRRMVDDCEQEGRNLITEILDNTVRAYGYEGLDEAEEKRARARRAAAN